MKFIRKIFNNLVNNYKDSADIMYGYYFTNYEIK